ncbi:V-snare-domain-containing protein [Clavulina sp. PMI_390]|nr:V-snare-domain-containing protein [Clavulina sp. PMI_390]
MATYDSLRRQSRTLESLVDAKLTAYTRLASSISLGQDVEAGGSAARRDDMELEIEGLLEKLRETHDEMATILNDPIAPPSQSTLHAVARHRDALQDYTRDFQRARTSVQAALDKANLLGSVRNDIDAYKTAHASDEAALLAERGRIDSSHRMTDDILMQAHETRADMGRQRTSILGVNTRMGGVINALPGINSLAAMIQSRRRRDSLILGTVVGVCMLLLLSYMWR